MKSYNNANFVPISWLFPLDSRLFNMTLKFFFPLIIPFLLAFALLKLSYYFPL